MRDATSIVSIAGLTVYLLHTPHRPDGTFTDGSKLGHPASAGASTTLPNGRIAICRVGGVPNSYEAELIGILLGSHFSPAVG